VAITIDNLTQVITVPQADLTLISGTLYEMDTEVDFRQKIIAALATEECITEIDAIRHNAEVTVAGVTFARTIEIINGYSVTFTPDSQWTVRLVGSNNNIFDVENGVLNQNQVQVISQNSAGLQIVSGGIASDVWGAALSSFTVAGTMGALMNRLITVGKWLALRGGPGK